MTNKIDEEVRLKAIADFKDLESKVNGMPYELIRNNYYSRMTHDMVALIDRYGGKTKGFDLNYKSIAVTIMDCDGFCELQGQDVEVYRKDGYMLGVMDIE